MNNTLFEIEQRFVSAVFIDTEVLDLLDRANLGSDIIHNEFLREVLGLCMVMRSEGVPVSSEVFLYKSNKKVEEADFEALAMVDLLSAAVTSMYAKSDFLIIVEEYKRRVTKLQALILQTLAEDEDWSENQAKARAALQAINDIDLGDRPLSQQDLAAVSIKSRQNIIDGIRENESVKIYTGIPCIDNYCRPLSTATGDFNCLLFAPTSTGKSSLMAQIVSYNVFRNLKVAVFLGETNYRGLVEQMAGQMSRVSIDEHDFSQEPKDRQKEYMECLKDVVSHCGHNLFIYDDRFCIEDVVSRCKKIEEELGGLDFVVIDHMHCLKTRMKFTDERLKYNYISGQLKPLGIDMDCPILCLAQPSRALKTGERPPQLSDLKESGNLEDDADRVWALWMPGKDSSGNEQERKTPKPEIKLYQLKFRRGRVTDVNLKLEKQYTLFTDNESN